MTLVVATGTTREAATLRGGGWTVIAGGGDAVRLEALLLAETDRASSILSFGMAGALADGLAVGEWVVGDTVRGGEVLPCNAGWSARLAAALQDARRGPIYADGRMILNTAEKRRLGERHGCLAVDMESHVAARVARARALPFAIARCISDDICQPLPPAFASAMRPDGALAIAALLRSVLGEPGQIGAVIRTGARFARAMRSLQIGARKLGSATAPVPARKQPGRP